MIVVAALTNDEARHKQDGQMIQHYYQHCFVFIIAVLNEKTFSQMLKLISSS